LSSGSLIEPNVVGAGCEVNPQRAKLRTRIRLTVLAPLDRLAGVFEPLTAPTRRAHALGWMALVCALALAIPALLTL